MKKYSFSSTKHSEEGKQMDSGNLERFLKCFLLVAKSIFRYCRECSHCNIPHKLPLVIRETDQWRPLRLCEVNPTSSTCDIRNIHLWVLGKRHRPETQNFLILRPLKTLHGFHLWTLFHNLPIPGINCIITNCIINNPKQSEITIDLHFLCCM